MASNKTLQVMMLLGEIVPNMWRDMNSSSKYIQGVPTTELVSLANMSKLQNIVSKLVGTPCKWSLNKYLAEY